MAMTKRIGLVGCVKRKLSASAEAKNLYISPLFRGRRRFVEQSCDSWWIVSAKHGLVEPEELLAPYDLTLKEMSRDARREWAQRVLHDFKTSALPNPGDVVEIHAGSEYRDFGLVDGLLRIGCLVEIPTQHLRMGDQLSFYSAAKATPNG